MESWVLDTPVTFIIFNRPEKTARVFEAIRQAKPKNLLIIADGPREHKPKEVELCAKTRKVVENIDWDCEVLKNYSEVNLGCRNRIGKTGLPWVFENVEETIVLEDDCIPEPTFFRFCQELLEKYRYDKRVMAICGTNLLIEWKSHLQSYHFSQFFSSWGWATWRRVWNLYDVEMRDWPNLELQHKIRRMLQDDRQFFEYKKFFDNVYHGKTNSWAYQMLYLALSQSCFSVIPSKNLISNIGFDTDATHTSAEADVRSKIPIFAADFPLTSPIGLLPDRDFETKRFFKLHDRSISAKISRKLAKAFPKTIF